MQTRFPSLAGGTPHRAGLRFFPLHEPAGARKHRLAEAPRARRAPGGRATFLDGQRPHRLHLPRATTSGLFACLEPFAEAMRRHGIAGFAACADGFAGRKSAHFRELRQKAAASRPGPARADWKGQ